MGTEIELTADQIKEIIRRELPLILRTDPNMEEFVLRVTRQRYADRDETKDRFERLLQELKEDREAQGRKWDENQKTINAMLEEIKRLGRRIDIGIGAIGARWGIRAEGSFRDALKGILEESFDVRVERYLDFDPEGKVFGRPDQVELDVIIRDGVLILCEIKSSISKSEMYTFVRKIEFYEEKHGVKAHRRLVISPMVEEKAKEVAESEDVEVYGYPEDIQEI